MPRIPDLLLFLAIGAACAHGTDVLTNTDSIVWAPVSNIQTNLDLTNSANLADGLTLSNAAHVLHLYAGRRNATLDGASVWLHLPPREAATNDLRDVARVDYDSLLQPILLATTVLPAHLRIVIDAGHGGDDTGASSAPPEVREKDVTLDIARHVATLLTDAGQQVLLTRANDVFEPLGERTRFAATHHAQLFVSIHANSSPSNPCAMGAETYILPAPGFSGTAEIAHGPTNACPGNRFDSASALLGFAIHHRCAPLTSMDRGLKRARYFVLKEASCPAALVECGFLTNTNDAACLGNSAYRQKLAGAIAAGILDYTCLSLSQSSPPAANDTTNAVAHSPIVMGQCP